MPMSTRLILIVIVVAVGVFAMLQIAYADGIEYNGPSKVVNCDNATEREDGTALLPDEIDKVEVYIRHSDPVASPEHTIIMPGGCQPMTLDLTQLQEGQKFQDGITFDTEGRVSVLSTNLPFVYSKAAPLPPVMTE